ncbi:MAG: hypothetical protein NXI22_15560, partial [bacterium]|nr:hypothetical protein [bacterium]
LVKWHLWLDRKSRTAEKTQIHNNLRSLGLARAAKYESPGFRDGGSTIQWLQIWVKAFGKDEVKAILKEQGVEDVAKYQAVIK